jgi:hypothetical protein
MTTDIQPKPNGPAAASILAAGVGTLVLGLMTTLAEASVDIKNALDFSKNYGIGSGVGPLSGKAIVAVIAYFVAWGIAGYLWRGREVNFGRVFTVTLVLIAIGFALTFPPVFVLFEPKE